MTTQAVFQAHGQLEIHLLARPQISQSGQLQGLIGNICRKTGLLRFQHRQANTRYCDTVPDAKMTLFDGATADPKPAVTSCRGNLKNRAFGADNACEHNQFPYSGLNRSRKSVPM